MAQHAPISLLGDELLTLILELAAAEAPTVVGCVPAAAGSTAPTAVPPPHAELPLPPPAHRRPTVCLTCKRWRRLFYAAPAIWRTFELDCGCHRLLASYRLLARVAPVVEAFECPRWSTLEAGGSGSHSERSLCPFLSLLQPDVATAVTIGGLPIRRQKQR